MTNQEKIIKLIGTDQAMYTDLVFKCYIDWCMLYSAYNIPLKTLVNNESLFNWYLKQFKTQVEDAFIEDNRDYITIANNNTKVFWDLFKTYPAVIENYYPRVLLKTIKATLKQSA
ncbi:hypothetical protein [Formosa sp. Hel1_33_131]|uniref:hypothetical protein n=1 Tax=Formosa sp. Hel1_33_131 TaxID=1336794 RepID=UPI00084E1111|nr:hypothetical protein [Formosa sp. Hel1_33_131]